MRTKNYTIKLCFSGYATRAFPDFSNFAWSSVMNSIAFEARKLLKKQNKNVKGGVKLPGGCDATYM